MPTIYPLYVLYILYVISLYYYGCDTSPQRLIGRLVETFSGNYEDSQRLIFSILTRQVATGSLSSNDSEADFQDLGYNADLYLYIYILLATRGRSIYLINF